MAQAQFLVIPSPHKNTSADSKTYDFGKVLILGGAKTGRTLENDVIRYRQKFAY